jgi:hypothetical protein
LQYSDISGTPSIPTGELVNDTTPQLGGDLDVNGKKIKSTTDVVVQVDSDNNTALSKFIIQNGAGTQVFSVDEEGTKLSTTGADNDIKIGNLDGSLGSFNGISLNGDLTYPGIVGFAGGSNQNDYFYLFGEIIDIRAGGASDASVRIEETSGNTRVVINSTFPIPQTHNFYVVGTGKFTGNVDVGAGLDVTGNITVTGTVDGIDIATDVAANTAKVGYTDAAVDLRIAAASLDDLSDVDTTTTAPTNGDALVWDNSASKWVPDGSGGSGGGGSDSFNTIQVSGQSDVVADSGNDTLTLVAGSNLAITTNATTDTITFTPSLTPTLTSATIGILLTSTGIVNSGTLSSGNTTINGTLSSGAITSSGTVQCQGINFAGAGTTTIAPVSSGAAFPDDLELSSNGNITMVLDYDSDESAQAFIVKNQAGTIIFQVDEDGISSGLFTSTTPTLATVSNFESTQTGTVTVSNYDSDVTYQVKLYNSSGTEQTSQTITDNSDGTWSITNGPILTGAYVEVLALEFGKLVSAVATSNSFNITAAATQQRYWRLQITDASKNPVHDKVAIGNFRLYTATGGGGTAYPSNMTSETTPSPYVVTKGYQYSSSYPAWKAMDGGGSSASSMWWTLGLSSANAANNWIQIDLGSSIDFGSGECQITTSGGWTDADYAVLYGSNTGDFTGEEREMAFFQNIDTSGQSGGTFTTFTESIT